VLAVVEEELAPLQEPIERLRADVNKLWRLVMDSSFGDAPKTRFAWGDSVRLSK
jgi:hypothetical protein